MSLEKCAHCSQPNNDQGPYARDGSEFVMCSNCGHDIDLGTSFQEWLGEQFEESHQPTEGAGEQPEATHAGLEDTPALEVEWTGPTVEDKRKIEAAAYVKGVDWQAEQTSTALIALSHTLPVKTIDIDGKPYLERYYIGTQPDGTQCWLHHFLTADGDRHLHNHPWDATSTVLSGGYTERLFNDHTEDYSPGDQNHIPAGKLHQIIHVQPGTWTFMQVGPARAEHWYFIDEATGQLDPMRTSSPDWHKGYKSKAEQGEAA